MQRTETEALKYKNHFVFHCSLYKHIRELFLFHADNNILNINEINEVDKISVYVNQKWL